MADDFSIDPSSFSLTNEFGNNNFDPNFSLTGDGGGFDFGQASFPTNLNFGVNLAPENPGMFAPGSFQQQPNLWDQIWRIIGGQGATMPAQGTGQAPGIGQQGAQPGLLSSLAQTGLATAGTGAGLAGIIQNLAQGRPTTSQQLRSTVQASPQQQQLTQQTLGALQNLQGLAQNAELQQAVSRLASGQLPISPDLVKQVTSAFGATAGNLAEGSIEDARNRGFSGGLGLLTGAGSPTYSRGLAQLQSDVSQALVNLALGLPTTAANIQNSLVSQAATPIQLSQGLLGQLQSFAGLQGGQNTQTLAPKPTLLSALQPIGQLASGLGQMGAGRQFFQPQQQQSLSGANPTLSGQ